MFDKEDKDYLERAFAVNPYPSKEDVEHFTKTTEKTCAQIRTWFSFRRQTEKKVNPEFAQLKETKVKMHPAEMFTEDDFNFLKRAFDENSYPSKEDIDSFSKKLGKSHTHIGQWFGNRRYKEEKKFSDAERKRLNEEFQKSDGKPSIESTYNLSMELNLTCLQITDWFKRKNRSLAFRAEKIERKKPLYVEYEKSGGYPSRESINKLCVELNLTFNQVYEWFNTRRKKTRRQEAIRAVQPSSRQNDANISEKNIGVVIKSSENALYAQGTAEISLRLQ